MQRYSEYVSVSVTPDSIVPLSKDAMANIMNLVHFDISNNFKLAAVQENLQKEILLDHDLSIRKAIGKLVKYLCEHYTQIKM